MAQISTPSYSCGGCSKVWTPLGACHCSRCHQTFGGINSFDTHRRYSKCRNPKTLGLELKKGVWKKPDPRYE